MWVINYAREEYLPGHEQRGSRGIYQGMFRQFLEGTEKE
ncbi:hypothetical protein J2743_002128 [Methanobacterium petrolearium]|nr:hypothetical protein [Methanobacterium petrolearium]